MGQRTIIEKIRYYGEITLIVAGLLGLGLAGLRLLLLDSFVTKAEAAQYVTRQELAHTEQVLERVDQNVKSVDQKLDRLLLRLINERR